MFTFEQLRQHKICGVDVGEDVFVSINGNLDNNLNGLVKITITPKTCKCPLGNKYVGFIGSDADEDHLGYWE